MEADARGATLARVLDPSSLDDPSLAAGRIRIERTAPIEAGSTLRVRPRKRVVCARCDGGGCSACGNQGAFRVDPAIELVVPISSAIAMPARIRVRPPVASDPATTERAGPPCELFVIELVPGAADSDNARVEPPRRELARRAPSDLAMPRRGPRPEVTIGLIVAAVVFATIVAVSLTR